MIDLHCHILPGIDDGAPDVATSLAMARAALADGISITVCSPHILPGVYDNTAQNIEARVLELRKVFEQEGVPLLLAVGADVHLMPDLPRSLRERTIPTIGGSRYFLLEPPNNVMPPRIEEVAFNLIMAGFVPILTHPERLRWIETHYSCIRALFDIGVWMQVTAGSLTGDFGRRTRYWTERMLDEGIVHIIATDAHDVKRRPPRLSAAVELAERRVGRISARRMVEDLPAAVLRNLPASEALAGSVPAH